MLEPAGGDHDIDIRFENSLKLGYLRHVSYARDERVICFRPSGKASRISLEIVGGI